jgi:DNA polymerase I-like protein with 3'-5' exonuclease and polymerase domains
VSKKERFNLRHAFGPGPGREWWSLDAKNIELRIPAFEAGERDMMEVFLHPKRPPYFGSYHLLVFDLLHPEKFKKDGVRCKELHESTWYQWVKNGNFAVIYGAQEETADRAYRVRGAFSKLRRRFPRIAALADKYVALADRCGFVETMPDKSVDSRRGYPLLCTRSEWGKVLPTVPLNYHVQGTAMWWMARAMVRCYAQLEAWKPFDAFIALQVHDELVFDFPRGGRKNLGKIRALQKLIERGGEDIGVPTPVSVELHEEDWSKGESF